MGIGMRIKEAAQARGITLRKLAEYAGISYNTLYSITKRDSERVDPETVKRIADALHVTIPYLYGMDDINALDIDEALKRGDQRTAEKLMGLPDGALNPPDPGYTYSDMERDLIFLFSNLNEEGQKEAVKRVDELTRLDEYCHPDAVRLLNIADIDTRTETAHQPPPRDETPGRGTDTTPPPEGAEGPGEGE